MDCYCVYTNRKDIILVFMRLTNSQYVIYVIKTYYKIVCR